MKRFVLLSLTALALAFSGASAKAGLIGVTVQSDYNFPTFGSGYENNGGPTLINPTASFTAFNGDPVINQLVTNTQIILTRDPAGGDRNFTSASFNGPVLTFLDSVLLGHNITGVSINFTNVIGFDGSRVTFGASGPNGQYVAVNLQGLDWTSDQNNITLDVTSLDPTPPSAVPEPGSLTVWGLGLFALAGMARRKRKIAA